MADSEDVYDADVQRITAAELMPILASQGGGFRLMYRVQFNDGRTQLRPAAQCSCPEAISEYERLYYRYKLDAEWSPSKASAFSAPSASKSKSEASNSRLGTGDEATLSKTWHDEGAGSEYADDAHLNDFSGRRWSTRRAVRARILKVRPSLCNTKHGKFLARAAIRKEWAARDVDETFKTPTTEGSGSSDSDDVSDRTNKASVKSEALSDDSLAQELKAKADAAVRAAVPPGSGPGSRVGRRRKAARLLPFDEWAFGRKQPESVLHNAPSSSGLQAKKSIFLPKASTSQCRKKIKMEDEDSSLPAMPTFLDGLSKEQKEVEVADLTLDSDIFTVDSD